MVAGLLLPSAIGRPRAGTHRWWPSSAQPEPGVPIKELPGYLEVSRVRGRLLDHVQHDQPHVAGALSTWPVVDPVQLRLFRRHESLTKVMDNQPRSELPQLAPVTRCRFLAYRGRPHTEPSRCMPRARGRESRRPAIRTGRSRGLDRALGCCRTKSTAGTVHIPVNGLARLPA